MTRRITTGLLALDLGLAAVLAALWLAPGPAAQWRSWQAPAPQPPSLDDIDAARLTPNPAAAAAYPAVLERPLMDPARRPQAAASAPAAAASAPPPAAIETIKLQGIVAGPALSGVLIEEDGQSRFVRRGERVGDWTLDSLQGRSASFVRSGERRRIELPVTYASADAAAPAAAPAGPGRNAARPGAPAAPAAAARPAPVFRAAPVPAPPPAAPAPVPAAAAAPATAPAPGANARPALSTGSFGGAAPPAPPAPANNAAR